MASTISAGTTTTTSLVYTADTSGILQLQTNGGTTAVTIDTSQRVGIGTTSPQNAFVVSNAGAAGIEFVPSYTGLATGPAIYSYNRSGSTWTPQVYLATSHYWGFGSNPSTDGVGMLLDTSGNLGLGVTPSAWTNTVVMQMGANATYGGAWYGASTTTGGIYLGANNYYNSGFKYQTANPATFYSQNDSGSGAHKWSISSGTPSANGAITFTQAMTLDNSGNLLVGQTSVSQTTVGFSVLGSGPSQGQVTSVQSGSTNATTTWNTYSTGAGAYRFYVDMGGTIHATSTSITAISDASLKTNIKPLETGLAEINRLQPRRFDWLDQDKNEGTNIAGFISQEVQEVLPDLTPNFKYNETETKLGLKMGDMIPTMVKAIQELSAKVTALEAKVG